LIKGFIELVDFRHTYKVKTISVTKDFGLIYTNPSLPKSTKKVYLYS